jgi:hypothetical protein
MISYFLFDEYKTQRPTVFYVDTIAEVTLFVVTLVCAIVLITLIRSLKGNTVDG